MSSTPGGGLGALLRLVAGLCLLRRGPQDLPHSRTLLNGLLLLAVGVDLLVLRWLGADEGALAEIAFSLVLTLLLPWIALALRGHPERYLQTVSALVAVGIVFTLVSVPLALQTIDMPPPVLGQPPTREQLVIAWSFLFLIGGLIAINGNIWRHALDWPRAAGMLFAAGLAFLEIALRWGLFAAPGA